MKRYPGPPVSWRFLEENPQFRRQNCSGYFATCLDYAHRTAVTYIWRLILETLDRYDIDGLELDFMREPYLFSADKEKEGAPILTGWMREVAAGAEAAARRDIHPPRSPRAVPARSCRAMGSMPSPGPKRV